MNKKYSMTVEGWSSKRVREKNKCVRKKWNKNTAVMVNMWYKKQLESKKERGKGKREENEGGKEGERKRVEEGGNGDCAIRLQRSRLAALALAH